MVVEYVGQQLDKNDNTLCYIMSVIDRLVLSCPQQQQGASEMVAEYRDR